MSVMTVVAPMTSRPSVDAGCRARAPGSRLMSTTSDGLQRAIAQPDDEVRAAGEDAGVRPALVEQRDRLGERRGPGVGERVHRPASRR